MSSLSDIVNILAQIKLANVVAQQIGIRVPAILTAFENDATAAIQAIEGFELPASLANDLADVAAASTAIASLASGPTLTGFVQALQLIKASAVNLESGQLAILGEVKTSFIGANDTVIVAAYRQSGQFAQIVDTGTTDTATVK